MPSYISHSIMGEELLEMIKKDAQIELVKESFKTYSIGPDLTILNDSCFNRTHSENTKMFFIRMIDYIIDNKLYENDEVMSFLYGHIAHYSLDVTFHPYIYYITEQHEDYGKIKAHTVAEYFLDYYLSKNKKNIQLENNKTFYRNDKEKFKELKQMINRVYKDVYNINNVSFYYKAGITFFNKIEKYLRYDPTGKKRKIYEKIFSGKLKHNNFEDGYIFSNSEHNTWYNPITLEKNNYSVDELYNIALTKAATIIEEIMKYIYVDRRRSHLDIAFENLSYDTGLDCNDKRPMRKFKKYKKK